MKILKNNQKLNKHKKNSVQRSYFLQKFHMDEIVKEMDRMKHSQTWLRNDTVDAWRHQRMKNHIDPLLEAYTKAKWLTVGDGRYGTDANYIENKGLDVLATDISVALLKMGKKLGFIKKYKKENAERLSFKDESFDFVFCKESLHHFPRPIVALYEMLRVAKKGAILIEPNDAPSGFQSAILGIVFRKRLKRRGKYFNSFEESGNYVYKISERELEKVALGLGLSNIAFKGIDDFYIKGVEYEKLSEFSLIFIKVKLALLVMEILYKLKFRQRSLLVAIIFKDNPTNNTRRKLIDRGFKIIDLPKNPYLT